MTKIPREITELRDELIAARKLIVDVIDSGGETSLSILHNFNAEFPCTHLSITEYIRQLYPATQDQPAEYGGYAICNECGERLDLDDVLSYAERIEGKQ